MGKYFILLLMVFLYSSGNGVAQQLFMEIKSPDFIHEGAIPVRFSCQGEDINPALVIKDVPDGTGSLVLIVDDPDAQGRNWNHWLVYNIHPATTFIPSGDIPGELLTNDFGHGDWGGPCPPYGEHRYFFRLYALDSRLNLPVGATRQDLVREMEDRILAVAELMGTYRKF